MSDTTGDPFLDKLNEVVDQFELFKNNDYANSFEVWDIVFTDSIPKNIEFNLDLFTKYINVIKSWDEDYFIRRLEDNQYLEYQELVTSNVITTTTS